MTSFRALDLLWPGFAAFMLLSWSCCDNDYYSAGLSVAAISGIDKVWLVPPLAAAAASIAILGIGDYLLPWLVFMTTISIPIAGVIIADFFILKRNVDVPVTEAIRLPAVLSWCLGAAASYFSTLAHLGIPPLQGILVACLSQVCLSRIPLLNPKIS
jgi:cytosine permease